MSIYAYEGSRFEAGSQEAQSILRKAHAAKRRPHCLCVPGDGPPMYVAKIEERFVLKRMPGTGAMHAGTCESFEPPAELTGLGDVIGSAIQLDPESGNTNLKLDFSLKKVPGRAPPSASGVDADTVRTDGQKLTLRGLLHYLWDEGGLTHWPPGHEGRRTWVSVHRALTEASAGKSAKGHRLNDRLLIPEPFQAEHKVEIATRRSAHLAAAMANPGRELFIMVAELKALEAGRSGFRAVVKQMPDYPVLIDTELNKRLQKRFAAELAMWDAVEEAKLMMVATFTVPGHGAATLEELAVMVVDSHWLPFETMLEKQLADELIAGGRRFQKGLRYNLPMNRPLASFVLLDAGPEPIAMYVVPANADEEYRVALAELSSTKHAGSWIWETQDGERPAIPERVTA